MPRTRTMQSEPGQPLLLPPSPIGHVANFTDFLEVTGLAASDVISSNLVTFPLPRYRDDTGPRQFSGLRPEAAWHPVFWLPRHLAGAMTLERDSEGSPVVQEDPDHHMVRVAIHLALSGLYDEVDGVWVDVLAEHGLEVDDPQVLERVRAWLAGAADPTLDMIDLTRYLAVPEAGDVWAVTSDVMDDLKGCGAALHSDALADDLDRLDEGESVRAIAELASSFLPVDPPPNADPSTWVPFELIADQEDQFQSPTYREVLGRQIRTIRDFCWPIMAARIERMDALLGTIEGQEPDLAW